MQKATACHRSAIQTLSNVGRKAGVSCMDRYCSVTSVSISGMQGDLETSPWGHNFPSGNI